jgi:hypothetical protein
MFKKGIEGFPYYLGIKTLLGFEWTSKPPLHQRRHPGERS